MRCGTQQGGDEDEAQGEGMKPAIVTRYRVRLREGSYCAAAGWAACAPTSTLRAITVA